MALPRTVLMQLMRMLRLKTPVMAQLLGISDIMLEAWLDGSVPPPAGLMLMLKAMRKKLTRRAKDASEMIGLDVEVELERGDVEGAVYVLLDEAFGR